MTYRRHKDVHVCSYVRTRKGRLEFVCSHWRSSPGQAELF